MKRLVRANLFLTFAVLCVSIACLFILVMHGGAPQ